MRDHQGPRALVWMAMLAIKNTASAAITPTTAAVMAFSGERALKDGQNELVVRFESPEQGGIKYVKTYTLKRGAYDVVVKHEAVNTAGVPVSAQL